MSRAEKIRGKFFGGAADKATNGGEDVPVSRSSSDVPLTIQMITRSPLAISLAVDHILRGIVPLVRLRGSWCAK